MTGRPAHPAESLAAWMTEALELAERGRFRVEPNPVVGALVVAPDGTVVGRGFHEAYGDAHAEVNALRAAGDGARGATVISTLEPCAHERKKTAPCVRAIIDAGVAQVVWGADDANVETRGRAEPLLRGAGIDVVTGVERDACDVALADYAEHLGSDVPWTVVKWAMSADGRVADASGDSRWITGEAARSLVHAVRARAEAIVVGVGTVLADDPQLTARGDGPRLREPATRVVFDSTLRTPPGSRVIREASARTLLFTTAAATAERRRALQADHVEIVDVAASTDGRVDLRTAFEELHRRGARRVLAEPGSGVAAAVLREGVAHQIMSFTAPVILGGDGAPTPTSGEGWPIAGAPRLARPRVSQVGDDALLDAYWPRG